MSEKESLCDWMGKAVQLVPVHTTKGGTRRRLRLGGDTMPANEHELRRLLEDFCDRYAALTSEP